VSTGVSIK